MGVGEVSPDTGLAIHCVHLHNLSDDFFAEYEEVKENDLVAFEATRRIGEVCNFNVRDLMPNARYADVARLDKQWEMQNLLVGTVLDKPIASVGSSPSTGERPRPVHGRRPALRRSILAAPLGSRND